MNEYNAIVVHKFTTCVCHVWVWYRQWETCIHKTRAYSYHCSLALLTASLNSVNFAIAWWVFAIDLHATRRKIYWRHVTNGGRPMCRCRP